MVIRPKNIPDDFEQLRPPVVRSLGSTQSERYLAQLADRTFLNLWSYANPHREQKQGGLGDGKELCDLLVVCDPHVIIFSEKEIGWPDKPLEVAWPRWFRKAVLDAATQLRGAERWISEFQDRIFLDKDCKVPFPLKLPPPDKRRVHRVVIARGAAKACRVYFKGGMGTLVIKPSLKGQDHCQPNASTYEPFAIGDLDPSGNFVHVFDEVALDIIVRELDTVTDFTEYLDKRAAFLRSGRLELAHGEEELLAHYAVRINDHGSHDFMPPDGIDWDEVESIVIGSGNYRAFRASEQYLEKKKADGVSYVWDRLIELFTEHMLGGTSIVLPGHTYSLTESEVAVRHMALQDRFARRSHSQAIVEAWRIGESKDVFFRAMLPQRGSKRSETAFFILTLKYMSWMDEAGGYEKYRLFRTFYLKTYAQSVLMKWPHLEQVIGVAMEPPNQGRGTSQDIIYAAQTEWADTDRKQVQEDCDHLRIMGPLKETPYHGEEYPAAAKRSQTFHSGNRKERRAQAARDRKK